MNNVTCYIYRCSAKQDMYLYLVEKDNFDCVPDELKKSLGRTDFAMQIELDENRKLAKENPAEVLTNLKERGFHLQMPSDTAIDQLLENISREMTDQADPQ